MEVASPTLSVQPVQWGPSLVLIRDHTKVCGGQYGVKKNNCFCCVDITKNKGCPSRHVLVKHRLTNGDDWVQSSCIYFHKGTTSGAVYAEPSIDVSCWKEIEIADLLGKQFSTWNDWKEEALVLTAAGASHQQAAGVRTAVKVSKKLPILKLETEESGSTLGMGMEFGQKELEDQEGTTKKGLMSDLGELIRAPSIGVDDMGVPSDVLHRLNLLRQSLLSLGESAE